MDACPIDDTCLRRGCLRHRHYSGNHIVLPGPYLESLSSPIDFVPFISVLLQHRNLQTNNTNSIPTAKMIGNSQLFLPRLEGTEVTLPSSDSLNIRGDTWVIDKKLNEVSCMTTREDLDSGRTVPSYTMGKFLCHRVGALAESAFMRIYSQVPIEDTQFLSSEVRAQQAVPSYQHSEIMALKGFKEGGCTVVPELLGYSETVQGKDGLMPRGYITYLVWDKVPGQSLSRELFWSFNKPKRDLIRRKFRVAHE